MLPTVIDEELLRSIKDALTSEGLVVFQLCLANAAGRKRHFIARNESEFELVLKEGAPSDLLYVFLPSSFLLRGIVDEGFVKSAVSLFDFTQSRKRELLDVIITDGNEIALQDDNFNSFAKKESLQSWLAGKLGNKAIVCDLEASINAKIHAYFPDNEGNVRRGSY